MAKSLILGLLSEHLGRYVEGIDKRDNLKFGVLSGHIEFHNLTLKKDALEFQNSLDLPITLAQGTIRSIKLDIPWTSLSTKPVKVYVEGVSVIAVPLDIHNLTKEDIKKRLNSRKAYHLANIDQQALKDDKRERGGLTDNTLHAYI